MDIKKNEFKFIISITCFIIYFITGKSIISNRVLSNGILSNEEELSKELEEIQERHICRQVRECLKPFRVFLNMIGRFPYAVHNKKRKSNKKKILPYPKKLRKITRFSRDSLRNLIKTEQSNDNNNSSEKVENGYALEDLEFAQNNLDEDDYEEDEYCYVYDECSFRSSFYYIITVLMLIAIGMCNEMFISSIYSF